MGDSYRKYAPNLKGAHEKLVDKDYSDEKEELLG